MNRPRVQPEHVRRQQIMDAAFVVATEEGLINTTIAKIAKQAQLSTGIVSHHFGDKQGLIKACMREMLRILHTKVNDYRSTAASSAQAQIKAIIDANFDASQTTPQAMRLWLEFWSASLHTSELQRLQQINDRRLYSNLYFYFLQLLPQTQSQIAATALAALIDGLWLRGSLGGSKQSFDAEQARHIAYSYLEMQLHLYSAVQGD
ncbi:transcriptional regulator BetI [Acinetobacter sp. MD2(2019)]|uniref:transcriptional regulator BetI n=1 Tax=Acinetobacter sp. MD2(2019) TaxID=2605273 RepID=UPI002D1EC3EE|nr:transcriptional regulator BetI [Acinetobacter sp. MD2(2019)]MEB3753924.1 transcriptional regulator BetI [Acinetobacter sp. MD2(2019)]